MVGINNIEQCLWKKTTKPFWPFFLLQVLQILECGNTDTWFARVHKYAFLHFTYLLQSAVPEHSVFLLKSWLWSFSDKGLTGMFAGSQKPKMRLCYWFVCERLFPQCFHPTLCIPLATGLKSIDSAPKEKLLGDFLRKISMQKATGPRSQNVWLATKVEC